MKELKLKQLKELCKVYEDYIKLLTEELSEVTILASMHGWSSSRVVRGIILRNKIKKLKGDQKWQ